MLIYEKKVLGERHLFASESGIPAQEDVQLSYKDTEGQSVEVSLNDQYVDDKHGGIIRKSDGLTIEVYAGDTRIVPASQSEPGPIKKLFGIVSLPEIDSYHFTTTDGTTLEADFDNFDLTGLDIEKNSKNITEDCVFDGERSYQDFQTDSPDTIAAGLSMYTLLDIPPQYVQILDTASTTYLDKDGFAEAMIEEQVAEGDTMPWISQIDIYNATTPSETPVITRAINYIVTSEVSEEFLAENWEHCLVASNNSEPGSSEQYNITLLNKVDNELVPMVEWSCTDNELQVSYDLEGTDTWEDGLLKITAEVPLVYLYADLVEGQAENEDLGVSGYSVITLEDSARIHPAFVAVNVLATEEDSSGNGYIMKTEFPLKFTAELVL